MDALKVAESVLFESRKESNRQEAPTGKFGDWKMVSK
jgi:hypothetical protein